MNQEGIGKCFRQVEHIRGLRYYITVNQVMVETVKFKKWWLKLKQEEPLIQ